MREIIVMIMYMNDKKYLIFLIFCSLVLFFIINIPTPIKVHGDGVFYYGWATSMIFDHDIDITNQLQQTESYDFYSRYFLDHNIKTQTHLTPNPYAFGTALLWMPFIFITTVVYHLVGIYDADLIAQSGYSDVYLFVLNFTTWLWGSIALIMIYKTLKYYFNTRISFIATSTLWLATPFVYYQFFEPSMSHTASIMMSSIFLWYVVQSIHKQKISYMMIGSIIFLMIAVRWQNIVFIVAMLPVVVHFFSRRISIKLFMTVVLSTSIFFVIQSYFWKILYDAYVIIPQGSHFIGTSFYFMETLFSTNRGLLVWSPIIMISLIGAFFLYKKQPYIARACILAFLLQWIVNSLLSDPGGGDAFGGRRFISTIPFIAVLLGAFVKHTFVYKKSIVTIGILLIVLNMFLIQAYRLNNIPHSGTITIMHKKSAL